MIFNKNTAVHISSTASAATQMLTLNDWPENRVEVTRI